MICVIPTTVERFSSTSSVQGDIVSFGKGVQKVGIEVLFSFSKLSAWTLNIFTRVGDSLIKAQWKRIVCDVPIPTGVRVEGTDHQLSKAVDTLINALGFSFQESMSIPTSPQSSPHQYVDLTVDTNPQVPVAGENAKQPRVAMQTDREVKVGAIARQEGDWWYL